MKNATKVAALGQIRYGKCEELEEEADKLLAESVGENQRSAARDIEKMDYEAGRKSLEELHYYDPRNDWDSQDSAFHLLIDPSDIDFIEPSVCSGDDGNTRGRNQRLQDRQELMRFVTDHEDWGSPGEEIPLLGANEGPRKTCTKCGHSKGFSSFSPDNRNKDGLQAWCKNCRAQSRKDSYITKKKK